MKIDIKGLLVVAMWVAVGCQEPTTRVEEKKDVAEQKMKAAVPEGWRNEIRMYPDSVALYDRIIDSMARAGNTDTAVAWADSLIDRDSSKYADYFLVKADLLRTNQQYTPAANAYRNYLLIKPGEPPVYLGLAKTLAEAGDSAALTFSSEIAERFPTPETVTGTYFIKGIYYSTVKNYAEARRWFDRVIERDYTFLQAWMEKGYTLYDEGKKEDAYIHFNKMASVHSRDADAWYWKAKTAEETGKTEEAITAYGRALNINPNITEATQALKRLGVKTQPQ